MTGVGLGVPYKIGKDHPAAVVSAEKMKVAQHSPDLKKSQNKRGRLGDKEEIDRLKDKDKMTLKSRLERKDIR